MRPGSFSSSNIDFLPRCLPAQEVCLCALDSGKVCGKRGRKGVVVVVGGGEGGACTCGCVSLCVHIHQNKELDDFGLSSLHHNRIH